MADPFEPTSPPPAPEPIPPNPNPPPEPPPRGETTQSTGLPSNIAAALACIPLVGGLIFWFLEKHDNFVRFYAMQSIIFGGVWVLFWIIYNVAYAILTPVPVIGLVFRILLWGIWLVVGIGFLICWIVSTVKAFTNMRWDIPYIGPMARKYAGE
jgi:uncharacterized membrane protein